MLAVSSAYRFTAPVTAGSTMPLRVSTPRMRSDAKTRVMAVRPKSQSDTGVLLASPSRSSARG
jgi:acyl dehydratase